MRNDAKNITPEQKAQKFRKKRKAFGIILLILPIAVFIAMITHATLNTVHVALSHSFTSFPLWCDFLFACYYYFLPLFMTIIAKIVYEVIMYTMYGRLKKQNG